VLSACEAEPEDAQAQDENVDMVRPSVTQSHEALSGMDGLKKKVSVMATS
jgi:hypothetical protein